MDFSMYRRVIDAYREGRITRTQFNHLWCACQFFEAGAIEIEAAEQEATNGKSVFNN